jgi:hypothetical protein
MGKSGKIGCIMYRHALGAVALSGFMVAPAWAGPVATYTMTGSVTPICTASAAGTLNFGTLTNSSGATSVQTINPTSSDSTAFCNQANTTVLVQRTNLTTSGATSGGFTNTLLITNAKVTSPQNSTGITDTSTVGSPSSSGTSGTIGGFTALTVSALAGGALGGNLLASGSYSGTVTVTLSPTN